MGDPVGDAVTARPLRRDEADEAYRIFASTHLAATGQPTTLPPALLDELFEQPELRPDVDLIGIEHRGRPVGVVVTLPTEPYSEILAHAAVRDGLPAGTAELVPLAVVQAVETSARSRADEPGAAERVLVIDLPRGDAGIAPALPGLGFRAFREVHTMAIDLRGDEAPPAWPDGVRCRAADLADDRDIDALFEVTSSSFADHHGDVVSPTREGFLPLLESTTLHPGGVLLAEDDNGAIGTGWGHDLPEGGYISTIGVVRRARGRGVASALLRELFAMFSASGQRHVTLVVDAESLTGATRVYESVGMRTVAVRDLWMRPLQ